MNEWLSAKIPFIMKSLRLNLEVFSFYSHPVLDTVPARSPRHQWV